MSDFEITSYEVLDGTVTVKGRRDDGLEIVATSSLREGCQPDDEHKERLLAVVAAEAKNMSLGESIRVKTHYFGGYKFIVVKDTGPPTWWLPRVKIRGTDLYFGWLRAAYGVSVRRAAK